MKCRKCKETMKDVPVSFDAFSFLTGTKEMYCGNQKCKWYGVVVVAGIPEEKELLNSEKK
jgi:hypothetical protein